MIDYIKLNIGKYIYKKIYDGCVILNFSKYQQLCYYYYLDYLDGKYE